MSPTPRAAKVLGVVAFGLVWLVGGLAMAGDDELSSVAGDQSSAQFPPGTIRAGPIDDELLCADYVAPRTRAEEVRDHADEFACMSDAVAAGEPAVLVRRGRTAAGYPVRLQVRVLGEDRLELIVDHSRNPLGDFSLQRSLCTGVDPSTLEPTGCVIVSTEQVGRP
jgi:hypothetical protein